MAERKKLTPSILLVGMPRNCPDIRYATQFSAPDPVVYLQHRNIRYLLVNRMELGRARTETRGLKVMTPDELALKPEERRRLSGWVLGVMQHAHARRATVPAQFPLGIARHLEEQGLRLDIHEGPLFPGRRRKNKKEIAAIRHAQLAAVAGYRAAVSLMAQAQADHRGVLHVNRRVLTAEAVRRTIQTTALHHDCNSADTIVAGGRQGADPHCQGEGPLHRGEPIVLDIFPQEQKHGYWGDLTRTVIHGQPSPRLVHMYKTVKQAQGAALAKIRAGVSCSAVHEAVVQVFDRNGYKTGMIKGHSSGFIHGTGHGVGLEIHEAPTLGGTDTPLQVGDVVTVEPGLYYQDLGGIRIEDTIVVTRSGYSLLAACPKIFRIA